MTPRLGDILVARGFVTDKQLQDALASHDARGGRLGAALVKQVLISVQQLGDALAEQFRVPFRQIDPADVNLQVVRLLPEGLVRDRQMTPVGVERGAAESTACTVCAAKVPLASAPGADEVSMLMLQAASRTLKSRQSRRRSFMKMIPLQLDRMRR